MNSSSVIKIVGFISLRYVIEIADAATVRVPRTRGMPALCGMGDGASRMVATGHPRGMPLPTHIAVIHGTPLQNI